MNRSDFLDLAERLVSTLPRPEIARLRELAPAWDVPPGSLVVMALDPREAAVYEPEDGFALALHLPDGQGFMFCFEMGVDPTADDLADPTRLWKWGETPDEPTLVLARGLGWGDVAAILGLDPASVPPPKRRIDTREFMYWIGRFIRSLQSFGDSKKGRALRLARETQRIFEGSTPDLDVRDLRLVFISGFHHLAGDLGAAAVNELAALALSLTFPEDPDPVPPAGASSFADWQVARAAVLRGVVRASMSEPAVLFRETDVEVDEHLAPFIISRRAPAANTAPKRVRRVGPGKQFPRSARKAGVR